MPVLVATSCRDAAPGRLEAVARLGEERGDISAEIGDETRYLLAERPRGLILMGARFTVPPAGPLPVRAPLGPGLAGGERIVVAPRATVDGRTWIELPPRAVAVQRGGGAPSVEFALDLPDSWRGSDVQVHAVGWLPHADHRSRDESETVAIPRGAVLEVGGGLLAAGAGHTDTRFRVSACSDGTCTEILSETLRRDARGWSDWRVGIDSLAGRAVTFIFETESAGGAAGAYSLAVWSRPTVYAPAVAAERRRNVILLSIDTLRADHLTSYGHVRDTAPKMREWFEHGGVLFEEPIAAATTTGPAHMTMFTSLVPTVHGVAARPGVRPPAPITLAEVLRANGYVTGAVTEDGPLHAGWGFSRGFDAYAENRSADVMLPEGHVAATFDQAEQWLRRHADKPFFLFIHTFEVHFPYTPPARYAALFGNPPRPPGLPAEYAPVLYDREIRHVDDQLDRFMTKLRAAGLLEDTYFIVTSDHGEEFLEHGFIGHGGNLHRPVLRVPLLIRGPDVAAGRRIESPVGHTDLMPTILDLLGIAPVEVAMGRSLAAIVRGETDRIDAAPLYSEAWYETAMLAGGQTRKLDQPSIAVRHGDRLLIRSNASQGGFAYRYFHIATDPEERRDLFADRAQEVADLVELLAGYEPLMEGLRRRADTARGRFGGARGAVPGQVDIDPAVAEKLRALGYVE